MVFAMQVTRTGAIDNSNPLKAASTLSYFHHDHLGSIAAISNAQGAVVERLAFDPWGKRRNANGLPDPADSLAGSYTDRGFTMHEHLDEVGVTHMNGRIYDPLIGRFMSADPFIQAPDNLQGYNRYAYVQNNPLNLVDPSGYKISFKKLVKIAVVVGVGYFTGGLASSAYLNSVLAGSTFTIGGSVGLTAGILGGAAGGFAAGLVGSGTLKGAVQGAFTGALFGGAGVVGGAGPEGANSFARYAAHAGAGCISSVAGGGDCGSGAASAVFGKFATNNINLGGDFANGVAAAVAGGVGSVIAGGKFENGATTAAFGYLFNQVAHAGRMAGAAAGPGGASAQTTNALAVKIDQFFSGIGDQLSYIFKSDSITLARNMAQETDQSRESGQHAHHIVAAGDPRADPARTVLGNAGMDINSGFNGVFLDPSQHARIHTNAYYSAVNGVLSGATGYADVATRLTGMRVLIQAGKFP